MDAFIIDHMLIKLGEYLRILGYDAEWDKGKTTHELIRWANKDGRIFLSRNKRLIDEYPAVDRLIAIKSTDPVEQLHQVVEECSLDTVSRQFTKCIKCNVFLDSVAQKAEVEEMVHPNVYARFDEFYRCSSCGTVFWKGTHVKNTRAKLFGEEVLKDKANRLFVAIGIPEETRGRVSRELLRPLESLRTVRTENLHITISFIGQGDEEDIAQRLSRVKFTKFTLTLGGVMRLGQSVICLRAEAVELDELADRVFASLGIENDFLGHLTLARGRRRSDVFKAFSKISESRFSAEVPVDRFLLMSSITSREGPEYRILKEFCAE